MSNIKLLVDSGSDITHELCNEYDIDVIPLNIIIDGKSYVDIFELDPVEYCESLKTIKEIPTTSQPSPATFLTAYEKFGADYDVILVMTMAKYSSGTYSSACIAKEMYAEQGGSARVIVFDTENTSMNVVMIAKYAHRLLAQGKEIDEVVELMGVYQRCQVFFYLVDNIEYLVKGGRISTITGGVISKLHIHPIVSAKDGRGYTYATAMGRKGGIHKMASTFVKLARKDSPLYLTHTNCKEYAEQIAEVVRETIADVKVFIYQMQSTMSTQAGPGTVGIFFEKA